MTIILVIVSCINNKLIKKSLMENFIFCAVELTNKDNMIQCFLTELSKQTAFIQKQQNELQKEVLIERNNTQYKNVQ